ncbi:splicing factor, suppressor of white-apricot homolog isoform X2 [Zingiber officinale]|uniref:splicing factor, suppressor of white-apricot homolog isoform X2 n=1 Tax=Zingiber officinale TaxID=94328 RepID=UPI001C4C099D|nr:splicing factor, suppressor of white-apricot homolog isoform X2 [Zingiber officinale]
MDLRLEGRHPLLFDDDAASAFINSADALVPWCGDPTLLIDRYDVRHLLDRIPPRPPRRASNRLAEEVADGGVTASQLDHERYLDLLPSTDDTDAISVASPDDAREISSDKIKDLDATYQAVPFSYGNAENAADPNKDSGLTYSGYRPAFPLPERLMSKLPDTEKLHQIIARTASFVSQHGGQSEIVLRVKQGDNPTFGFLMPDHHLHEYFRFLVDHPQLLNNDATSEKTQDKEKLEEQNKDMLPPRSGALSLLGSVYGSIEDDDDTNATGCTNPSIADNAPSSHSSEQALKTLEGHNKIKTTNSYVVPKDMTSTRKKLATRSSSPKVLHNKNARDGKGILPVSVEHKHSDQFCMPDVKPVLLEPPSFLKRMIEKIVEFIIRNGKEFEAILVEQDKSVGRFPFLVPSNQHHAYYLKVLEEAHQGNARSKNKGRNEVSEAAHCRSSDMSEEWFYDPHRKEKFKMVIGGSKKEKHDQDSNRPTQSGASVDEAAAIVLAVTRGVSPANARQHVAAPDSTLGLSQREALLGSSAGSFSSLPDQDSMPKRGSSYEAGTSLHLSGLDPPSKRASRTVDDVWIAKAIAKTAALAASREADSSEASLTKEQKLKAERLKRARMFSAMIKSGNPLTTTCSAATDEDSSLHICAGTDIAHKEREGSSVPHDANVSARTKSHGREIDQVISRDKRERHRLSSQNFDNNEDEDGNHKRHKSRQWSEHYSSSGRKHRKHHSSSDRVSRHHKHHSSSEDEYRHRKKSHHHKDEDASEDEENEKKLYDKHRNKHHSRSQRNHLIEREMNRNKLDQPEIAQKLSNQQQELNMPGSSDTKSTNASTEVSSGLRERILAMLRENL